MYLILLMVMRIQKEFYRRKRMNPWIQVFMFFDILKYIQFFIQIYLAFQKKKN